MRNDTKIATPIIAIASLALVAPAITLPAVAAEPDRTAVSTPYEPEPVTASPKAPVDFEKEEVKVVSVEVPEAIENLEVIAATAKIEPLPAPVVPSPEPAAVIPTPEPVVEEAPEPEYVAPTPEPIQVQAAPEPVEATPASNRGLAGAALAQVGITQDCTAMVENALAAIGRPVGDLGPSQFLGLGTIVSSPAPGDIVVTGGHVAIYIGDGNVVSGGMNGVNATMIHPLSDLGGPTFVRV